MKRAADGDRAAFHELVERHGPGLFRLAVSLAGNASDAEDLLQETLAGAYRGLARFEGRASVKTWMSRILVTQVARWRRGRSGKIALSLDGMSDASAGANGEMRPGFDPAARGNGVMSVDQRIDLQAALRTLSPEHRQVLTLREYQGLSYDEIAQALGIPRGTVESRLHRARAEMRDRLKSYLP